MMYVLDGFTLLMTRGTPITNLPSDYKFIGRGYLGPIPFIVVILLVLVAVFAFIFKYTQFGRNIVTVGENATSARLSGINVVGIKISAYACAGALSALDCQQRAGNGLPLQGKAPLPPPRAAGLRHRAGRRQGAADV